MSLLRKSTVPLLKPPFSLPPLTKGGLGGVICILVILVMARRKYSDPVRVFSYRNLSDNLLC